MIWTGSLLLFEHFFLFSLSLGNCGAGKVIAIRAARAWALILAAFLLGRRAFITPWATGTSAIWAFDLLFLLFGL